MKSLVCNILFMTLIWPNQSCDNQRKPVANVDTLQIVSNPILNNTWPNGLVCHWNFGDSTPYMARGLAPYRLYKANDSIRIEEVNGLRALSIQEGGYLYIPREKCLELNFSGKNSNFTIIAKINRRGKSYRQCEAIAGMWNETNKKRQYCLFLNLMQKESGDQVCGHVSNLGGSTPGHKWARDASIGSTVVPFNDWVTVAFSYNGKEAKSYLDGNLDIRDALNPYQVNYPLFDGGVDGSDFTIGAVDRLGEMGNFFVGGIAHLAIFKRALSDSEMQGFTFER